MTHEIPQVASVVARVADTQIAQGIPQMFVEPSNLEDSGNHVPNCNEEIFLCGLCLERVLSKTCPHKLEHGQLFCEWYAQSQSPLAQMGHHEKLQSVRQNERTFVALSVIHVQTKP